MSYLADIGFLDSRVVAVHGVQCTGDDLARLAALGTTVVSCPRSNRFVGVGDPPIEAFLKENGITGNDVVIVRNAPGYYLETGRSALPIPYGDEDTVLHVARQFQAYYLVLEESAVLDPMKDLYENPNGHPNFIFLGELDDANLYHIEIK